MPKECISLNSGDPDVEALQYAINEALMGLIEGGMNTHYSHSSGYPTQFQEAVVDYYKKFTGVEYDSMNVISAAGSSPALYIVLASVLEPGDEVLIFTPFYLGHKRILEGMGVKTNMVPLYKETNYHPDVADITEACMHAHLNF